MKKIIFIILLLPVSSFQSAYSASDTYVLVGGSRGRINGPNEDYNTTTIDLTYGTFPKLFSSSNPYWFSLGARSIESGKLDSCYAEGGTYFIIAIGAGISSLAFPEERVMAVHLYFGLPVPLPVFGTENARSLLIVEPYYRPAFGIHHKSTNHEIGILFKVAVRLN